MEQEKERLFDGRYRLIEVLGIGTSAKVYRAVDTECDAEVAVKIFDPALLADEEARKQFDYEVKAFALLDSHPNIVSYFGGAMREDCRYIVMELATGETLMHLLNRRGGKLPLEEALSYFSQLLAALAHAHSKGVIHRDVKPQNIRLLDNGLLKLVDFGIAIIPGFDNTAPGKAVGTVNYISPEQATGGKVDARSDLYSAGIVLYEMLSGHLPYTSEKKNSQDRLEEIVRKHLKEVPIKPHSYNPNIPTAVEQIILRAMSKNPAKRFDSAEEMLRYIKRYDAEPRIVFDFDLPDDSFDAYDALPDETSAEHFIPSAIKYVGTVKRGEKKPEEEKKPKFGLFMTAVCLFFLLLFLALTLFSVYHLFWKDGDSRTVITVGELLYTPYNEDLARTLADKGYEVKVEYRYSEIYPKDTILEQIPAAQTAQALSKDEKPHLTLVISGGCRVMLMYDYADKDYREVKGELEALGFTVQVEKQANNDVPAGNVIATSPKAGETAIQSEPIFLYVSTGEEVVYRYVPNLIGMSYTQAKEQLERAGIRLSGVTYAASDAPAGRVIFQSIPYGDKIAADYSGVTLTLSNGHTT